MNDNKHGAANGYDKDFFADNISSYSSSADDISARTGLVQELDGLPW